MDTGITVYDLNIDKTINEEYTVSMEKGFITFLGFRPLLVVDRHEHMLPMRGLELLSMPSVPTSVIWQATILTDLDVANESEDRFESRRMLNVVTCNNQSIPRNAQFVGTLHDAEFDYIWTIGDKSGTIHDRPKFIHIFDLGVEP